MKVEINLQRLLMHCETMATDAQQNETKVNWRLAKYLKLAEKEVWQLEQNKTKTTSDDAISNFKRKITFLKDIVKADETDNPLEKILVCQHLLPSSVISSNGFKNVENELKTKELHLQLKGKFQKDLRKDLLDQVDSRHPRSVKNEKSKKNKNHTEKNIDDIIKQHHDMQEKVAEEMIRMAQSMKQNSLRSREIIKKDQQELTRSKNLVVQNLHKLKIESERLEEMNNRKCSWSIWLMLGIVCIVFINMIIFIKFFPKKKSY